MQITESAPLKCSASEGTLKTPSLPILAIPIPVHLCKACSQVIINAQLTTEPSLRGL